MDTKFTANSTSKAASSSLPEAREIKPAGAHLKETAEKIDHNSPRLLFLSAPSTSGKSSIMAAYAKREKAEELGADDFRDTRRADLLKKRIKNTKQYAILSKVVDDKNLYNFFSLPPHVVEKFFKADTPKADREAALEVYRDDAFFNAVKEVNAAIMAAPKEQDEAHFKAILDLHVKGNTVIFDSPNVVGFFEYLKANKIETPVERFLIYVPLTKLIERLPGRNAQAEATDNLFNIREHRDILKQFKDHYRPQASEGDVVVGILAKEEVLKIFRENKAEIDKENSRASEGQKVNEDDFLKHFGLDKSDQVSIVSSDIEKFEHIFKMATETHAPVSATECAEQLAKRSWMQIQKRN